ncbi:probable inactive receptor kinase at4g23740 [Phtheirospermum japonicum]|uniref:Probable inactive receptor kinase at4g23740 n=1 Tax=Phtheirospermum japonicum TaxID=374723 RepID=A0A830C1V4_9LAMI|nr:probable inactive receptor kinase at4g23740 [Phtheirospermum japonicum]
MSEVLKMLKDISKTKPITFLPGTRKLVFIEEANATYVLEDILKASAEALGKGIFGTCYKATLENGNIVVVRRLRDLVVTLEDFQYHMEMFGMMRHENVAQVRAYYFSGDEKLAVYDYYDQGSVFALLHGNRGRTDRTPLDWESRMRIAVGAARGVAHIHRNDGQKLVHGNIKSTSIFLGRQNYGIVSDAGLAKLSGPIRLSPGYCATEVTDTASVSQASDIYSFGVLLLELVTRKQPYQVTRDDGEVSSLVNLIESVGRDEWTEVIDAELLRDETEEEIMAQLLQIAMYCISFVPEHRPRMSEVLRMLEDISGIEPESGDQVSIESRFEYLLEGLLFTLTP